jgi:hypothetical protein
MNYKWELITTTVWALTWIVVLMLMVTYRNKGVDEE